MQEEDNEETKEPRRSPKVDKDNLQSSRHSKDEARSERDEGLFETPMMQDKLKKIQKIKGRPKGKKKKKHMLVAQKPLLLLETSQKKRGRKKKLPDEDSKADDTIRSIRVAPSESALIVLRKSSKENLVEEPAMPQTLTSATLSKA